jgi:hypothetical protein
MHPHPVKQPNLPAGSYVQQLNVHASRAFLHTGCPEISGRPLSLWHRCWGECRVR